MNDNRSDISRSIEFLAFAFSGVVFASTAIVALVVYGDHASRVLAILSAILACASQFIGSNTFNSRKLFAASIILGWAAFASISISLLMLAF